MNFLTFISIIAITLAALLVHNNLHSTAEVEKILCESGNC